MFVRKGIYFQSDPPATGAPPSDVPVPEKFPTSWEEIFQHPRFKELNTKAQQATAELERIKAAEKEANNKALAEQNKWQELYQSTQTALAVEKVSNLRLKVASSKGLPIELVERLRGETEEEISKDADGLLLLIKPKEGPGLPRTRGNNQAAVIDLQTETDPAKIREAVRQGATK